MKSGSNLEKVLRAGHFAFTGELGPPRGAHADEVRKKAAHLKGHVDSVNITDNQTAVVRMASWAASLILVQEGLEPNYQMVCRDRNRLAMQADILGAAALGIRNMLCLSGDHCQFGDHPTAKGVFDVDSMQLISMVRQMRDEGKFFIQTQCIYNMPKFREFIRQANDMGLTEKAFILAGITPMKSLGMAKYMKAKVPGMDVPDDIITRLQGVARDKQAEEGIKIALDQIAELREMKGVAGIHLMAIEWEHRVPEIAERAGMLPRPTV